MTLPRSSIKTPAMMTRFLAIGIFLFSQVMTLCITQAYAIDEDGYFDGFATLVAPFWESGISGSFVGKENVEIVYRKFEADPLLEKGALVVLPGRGMPMMSYAETIFDLNGLGLSVYILDHRGQGDSGRMIANTQMQYVEKFEHYVDDLSVFMDTVVNKRSHSRVFFLGDSMGCAIGSLYIKRISSSLANSPARSAATVKPVYAAVFSAPMYGIYTNPFYESFVYALATGARSLGFGSTYLYGQHDFEPIRASESVITKSESRYGMMNKIFADHPEARIGGISYQWYLAAEDAIAEILNKSYSPSIPTLLLQAEHEFVVRNENEDQICGRSKLCEKLNLSGAYHDVYLERDPIRNEAMHRIRDFLERQIEARSGE